MVIYSTTNDKPVLGEMWKWDFVKCWQKGILCIEEDWKTPPVACQWNTRLKPPLQTPIFSVPAPPSVDFSGLEPFYLILLWCYCQVEEKIFDIITKLCYNSQRKIMKNLLKFIIMLLRKIEKILQKTGR